MMFGQIFCGRPICDITNSAKELNLKVRSYDLTSLCVAVSLLFSIYHKIFINIK